MSTGSDGVYGREQAWQLLTEWTQSESLRKHALAVEACVTAFGATLLIEPLLHSPWTYALGVAPFCIFVCLVVVFMSNAVNLTDGLDGLAIGLMVIAAGALTDRKSVV